MTLELWRKGERLFEPAKVYNLPSMRPQPQGCVIVDT
jgi:hypothetical protein